ncbi:hypothetical protein E2P63_03145 [Candidatus Bathyarchaeota archaeon]|nr:hypothetical protein E2P63_03145 [Candidatus Bathyarchaeota archaeon]
MKKKILGVFVSLFVVAMLALPMSIIYAKKPMPVQGTFFPAGAPTVVTSQPGNSDNLVVDISDGPQMWTGSFVGSAVSSVHWNIIKSSDEEAPGHHVSGKSTFTLDVVYDDKEGTLTIKGDHSNWRIISGTGDLANLRGHGTFYQIDITIMLMGYEGEVHFDP